MSGIVEVAAAVLLRRDGRGAEEFLLAQRPEGKVYAGYWEFPGGKLEAGETVREALVREIREELGITVTAATPWLTRQFTYPHATVRIHFWRVTAWEGEIGITAPLEHSAVAWLPLAGPPSVAPILPANDPILKALALPTTLVITNAEENGVERELERLEAAFDRGQPVLVQIRDKTLAPAVRLWFADAVSTLCRPRGVPVVVNDDAQLAQLVKADGLHLSARSLADCRERPDFTWVGASCHDWRELARAAELGFDYALLGPVRPTPTHPEAHGLGWPAWSELVQYTTLPVFALGGMQLSMLREAQEHGAHGIALMRGW